MENYLLCNPIEFGLQSGLSHNPIAGDTSIRTLEVYKGRKKGYIDFIGIWKHDKTRRNNIAKGVRLMHNLDHRNVLKFLEWYETPKHIWVITELATGGSLATILEQDGFICSPHVDDFIKDLAAGLAYIHSKGVLYCDLQPCKILLDSCQCLKLSDFTLAQSVSEHEDQDHYDFKSAARMLFGSQSKLTKTVGTSTSVPLDCTPSPLYAAPELYLGSQFTVASDLWSLGCVIFELCTGKQPFHQCCGAEELIEMMCYRAVDLSSLYLPPNTAHITHIISCLLFKSPHKRMSLKEVSKAVK